MSETTRALCCHCGAVRTVSAHCLMDRELRCAACKTARNHAVLGYGLIEDWREGVNRENTAQVRQWLDQVDATEAVLDTLGVRLDRRPMTDACARLLAKRGPGWMDWLVTLADDLSVLDQLDYLASAWEAILPAYEDWTGRADWWEADERNPQVLRLDLVWSRKEDQ